MQPVLAAYRMVDDRYNKAWDNSSVGLLFKTIWGLIIIYEWISGIVAMGSFPQIANPGLFEPSPFHLPSPKFILCDHHAAASML